MKKIAIIIPGFAPVPAIKGGAIENLITLLIEQNEDYNDIIFDVYTIDDPCLDKLKYKNTNIIRIKRNICQLFIERLINHFLFRFKISKSVSYYSKKSIKYIKKNNIKYDYIIVENNMNNYYNFHNVFSNIPFIFHLHNDIGNFDKPEKLCKYINETAYKIITCSNFLKIRFETVTNSKKVYVLNNCIDENKFFYDENARKTIRMNNNLDNNEIVFGYIGRISQEKGILELLISFNEFSKNKKNVKLMIIGGNLYSRKNNFIKKVEYIVKEMRDKVIMIGEVNNDDIHKYLSSIDCVIIPTVCEEAFGIVALESMYCKRPLIITNSGGLIDVVKNTDTYIFDKENFYDNCIKCLNDFYNNYNEENNIGNNNYTIIRKNDKYKSQNYYNEFRKILNLEGESYEKNTII